MLDLGPPSAPPPGATGGAMSPPVSGPPPNFGQVDLPPRAEVPDLDASPRPSAPPADPLEADPFGEAAIPSHKRPPPARPVSAPPADLVRQQGGGTSYGEVNLDAGSALPIEDQPIRSTAPPRDEDMEFGALPQEPAAAAAATASVMPSHAPKRRRRWPVRLFAGLLAVAVGGGALSFVPAAGPYGVYFISDWLNASKHEKLLAETQILARRELGKDLWQNAERLEADLERVRAGAKRLHALSAYVA
jgi:hypothetical protein